MPRIRFLSTPKIPRDLAPLDYKEGDEVDLPQDQADRWLVRGIAVVVPDAPKQAPLAAKPATVIAPISAVGPISTAAGASKA